MFCKGKFLNLKNILSHIFLFSSLIGLAQTKSLQTTSILEVGTAASVGMSDERLWWIDTMCTEAIKASQVPGIVALVARKGTIVYHKAFGFADNTLEKVMEPDAIFRIASQTKAITATAVMMLWEEGRFNLDDNISKFIPEFGKALVLDSLYSDGTYTSLATANEITIRHLLTHTSGIGYGEIDKDPRFQIIYRDAGITDLFTTEKITIAESVRALARLPLHHGPGEGYTYSEGLDVLGYFVEVISGLPLDEFMRSRIFEPLGMKDTWFYLPESRSERLVPVQTNHTGKWRRYPVTFYDPDYPVKGAKTFFSGGAGLMSTAYDYALFLQMFLNNGELNGVRYLSRTTIRFMMANQIGNLWENETAGHGLSFRILNQNGEDQGGKGSAGSFDWGGYFNTQYFADPNEQVIGILMKQTRGIGNDDTSWKFRQLVGQAIDD